MISFHIGLLKISIHERHFVLSNNFFLAWSKSPESLADLHSKIGMVPSYTTWYDCFVKKQKKKNTAFAIFLQYLVILVKIPPPPEEKDSVQETLVRRIIGNLDSKYSLNLSFEKV